MSLTDKRRRQKVEGQRRWRAKPENRAKETEWQRRPEARAKKVERARLPENRAKGIERNRRLRAAVLNHYGNECARCGTTENLEIDHINEDGAQHRERVWGGNALYQWLVTHNFETDYELQTLCHSCNMKKAAAARKALR